MNKEFNNSEPAYTKHPRRLQDVICAIQVMGSYATTTARATVWEGRISSNPVSANDWESLFNDHPEFFRSFGSQNDEDEHSSNNKKIYSLVLRRSQPRLWLREEHRIATNDELAQLGNDLAPLTWQPLTAVQITALVEIAIKLHGAEWSHKEKTRWWFALVPAATGFVGALLGALVPLFK